MILVFIYLVYTDSRFGVYSFKECNNFKKNKTKKAILQKENTLYKCKD